MDIGAKNTRLTIIGFEGPRQGILLVKCDCGNETKVKRAYFLNGNTKSCGCWKRESAKNRFTKHGEVKHIDGRRIASKEYRAWQNLKNRCLNQKAHDYAYYGGRGITLDESWLDFNVFLEDMGRSPTPAMTIERIDGDKGYSKDNCIWVDRKTQSRNRKYASTRAWELAEQLGVKDMTAHHYIWRVRAMDKGKPIRERMTPELERLVRDHIEKINKDKV